MPASSLVILGRLTKPHGVKGEIRVDYYADSADLLEKPLMLRAGRFAPRPVRIREWHLWKDQLILSLEGCNDRSAAEQLRGQELLIDASFLPETEEDEPYLRDLIGLSVRLEDGTVVGKLEDVDFPAGQEMWIIRAPEADGGYEILFPAVPEFVLDIDLSAETATIAPPEGLLDLYREGAAANVPDDGKDEEGATDASSKA
ncbi:ribosome maturation factor RimM [Mailhella massiliensis]|uniref:Ribosome maturation factor RimM n=1 Tax=Mailhella massiliensis TaxID=1903261 RepID=A0A921AXF0_9BACT|nr:ribosome maturation factor RimM [Mailhella massiliensis]HJD97619.1 ribosome maturation factor RimM [Mailhella massiliensis]